MDSSCQMDYSAPYTVTILKEGLTSEGYKGIKQCESCSVLVTGPHNVLIGTGLPKDTQDILNGLRQHNVDAENIEYVVCNQGAAEFIGNLNLFPKATHIVGCQIIQGNQEIMHQFKQDIPYEIDEHIQVLCTPGPSQNAVSVLVGNSNLGTVAISGRLFHSEEDLEDSDLWQDLSLDLESHQQSRINILTIADHIVPHVGKMFRVPDAFKGSDMKVIMTP